MEIDTKKVGIGVVISLCIGMGTAYMDIRDRLTRMETQLDILAPVAVDHMVAVELEKRNKFKPPDFTGGDTIVTGNGTSTPAPDPPVLRPSKEEIENIRREKEMKYRQSK